MIYIMGNSSLLIRRSHTVVSYVTRTRTFLVRLAHGRLVRLAHGFCLCYYRFTKFAAKLQQNNGMCKIFSKKISLNLLKRDFLC